MRFLSVAIIAGASFTVLAAWTRPGNFMQDGQAVARGKYLVEDVAVCGRCHTPSLAPGQPDPDRWLMGGAVIIQPTLPTPDWALIAPRLAGAPPGTDAQFITLLTTGISRTGRPPRPPMPQFRLTRDDAEAVLAYLKSLGGGEEH